MANSLTIVMYHYVRQLEGSAWPRIKGRRVEEFERQLEHVAANYTVVDEPEVAAAFAGQGDLPPDACWLTFDDGFVDHYEVVFPRLADRGWRGSFFPAAGPVMAGRLLDVHRIHFVLASAENAMPVFDALMEELRGRADLADLKERYFAPNRFDPAEVNFVKRVLQLGLDERERGEICGRLFARFVTADEADFAASLYMSIEQMREMAAAGMHFGGHGLRHRWLGSLTASDQQAEIAGSLELLARIQDRPPDRWTMCYPYGSYNADTMELLQQAGCDLALTTKVGLAAPSDPPLELPRLDTNDLPH